MSFRPLKLEYESDGNCSRCGGPPESSEHDPSNGGNHAFEDEPVEFVTLRSKRYDAAPFRALFEGSVNYAMVVARDEPDEMIGAVLEVGLALGWAFVTATSVYENAEGPNVFQTKTTLYFKWIGD